MACFGKENRLFSLLGLVGRSRKQTKPAAWQKLSGDALAQAVYDYTKEVLAILDESGVYPDLVQVEL